MEDLLAQIIKEATTPKLNNLKNASQNALGMLKLPRFFSCSRYILQENFDSVAFFFAYS